MSDYSDYSDEDEALLCSNQVQTNNEVPVQKVIRTPKESLNLEDLRVSIMNGVLKTVIDVFEKEGLDINITLKSGWTGLMYAAYYGKPDIVQYFVNQNATINFQFNLLSPLLLACSSYTANQDDLTECVKILLDNGADVHQADRYHTTAMIFAAREGHLKILELLVQAGANVNFQDSQGKTPLAYAASRGYGNIVHFLLESGADLNIRTAFGMSILDICYDKDHQELATLIERYIKGQGDGNELSSYRKETAKNDVNSYMRYQELELFLSGLKLTELIPLFQFHQIEFQDLLLITDETLQKIGIEKIGMRNKIIEAVQSTQTAKWNKSSLLNLKSKKRITCPEMVALMANINKHILYIGTTFAYLKRKIAENPEQLEYGKEDKNVVDLFDEGVSLKVTFEEAMKKLSLLQTQLSSMKGNYDYLPVDRLEPAVNNGNAILTKKNILLGIVACPAFLVGLYLLRRSSLGHFLKRVILRSK